METIRLFAGVDPREEVGIHVFLESLWKQTSLPIAFTALTPKIAEYLRIGSDGTNAFSTLRFSIPRLCNYSGSAIFADSVDMLLRSDLTELWKLQDPKYAVQCVKHKYRTKHPRKYIGTDLESDNQDYERKNWSSLVLWNCAHWSHFRNRDKLLSGDGKYLHRFTWLNDEEIGDLPASWNHLVGEQPFNQDVKLAHFTLGIPGFEHYKQVDYADEWIENLKAAAGGLQYGAR